jgi:hypothetical protein
MTQFLIEDVQPVMEIDAGVSSHPIVVDVTNPDEINEVFDKISYSKGAAVIRMLESMMGKTAFFQVHALCIGRESKARLSIEFTMFTAIQCAFKCVKAALTDRGSDAFRHARIRCFLNTWPFPLTKNSVFIPLELKTKPSKSGVSY